MAELQTHHVGVVVSDLDKAISFYRDIFGLSVADEFTLDGKGIATAIDAEDVTGDFAHLDADGALVELIEYDPVDTNNTADAINKIGAKHIGFGVDDIDTFYEELPETVDVISDPQPIEIGTSIMFIRDPDGNFVEIVEA